MWQNGRENHCFVFKAAGAALVQNSLIYGEKQLNTANLRSKQGNQLRGVKIKILSKKRKTKNSNFWLVQPEFTREWVFKIKSRSWQFRSVLEGTRGKRDQSFLCENNTGEKKTGSSQLLKNLRILSDKGLSKSL